MNYIFYEGKNHFFFKGQFIIHMVHNVKYFFNLNHLQNVTFLLFI